jgi:hypothetical protein
LEVREKAEERKVGERKVEERDSRGRGREVLATPDQC